MGKIVVIIVLNLAGSRVDKEGEFATPGLKSKAYMSDIEIIINHVSDY